MYHYFVCLPFFTYWWLIAGLHSRSKKDSGWYVYKKSITATKMCTVYNLVVHCRCAVGHVNLKAKQAWLKQEVTTKKMGLGTATNAMVEIWRKQHISYLIFMNQTSNMWLKWCLPCVPPVRWAIDFLGLDFWDDQATISQMPPRALGSLRPLPDGARFIALHCWGSGSVLTLTALKLHDQRWVP